jgi:response regulator RpfG family c-di-GMP phosphodiesterase
MKDHYQLLLAKNGAEGLIQATEHQPDLILSDMIMPELSGLELLQRVKSKQETSHIPFILLTAKKDKDFVTEALATRADDHIAKPFNSEELLLKLKNLFKQRENWMQKYRELPLDSLNENQLSKVDQQLLNKLNAILEENYSSSDFSVLYLASELNLSKTHLNRKLNALRGESANKVVQNFRLHKAHQMLQKKKVAFLRSHIPAALIGRLIL